MRRYHHALTWCKIERRTGCEIHLWFGFEIAGDFRTQNDIPRKPVAARQRNHERNVAVRNRRDHEVPLEAHKSGASVRPAIEAMPSEIEIGEHVRWNGFEVEARQDPVEIFAMQHVQLA